MQLHDEADGTLVLTYDSKPFVRFLFIIAALMLAIAAYDYFLGTRGTDRLIGLLGGCATCAVAGTVFFEQARVVVNRATKTIEWSRRWALSRRSGSLSFDQITSVFAERPIGDEGVPSRRVVLRTKAGESIPLTVGYRPDGDGMILRASERIGTLLGPSGQGSSDDSVRALVAAGRVIDAIKQLREAEALSLEEAKRRVDELARDRPS